MILIQGNRILDATPTARAWIDSLGAGTSWRKLEAHLCELFPEFAAAMDGLVDKRSDTVLSKDRGQSLTLVRDGDGLRLSLNEAEADLVTMDRICHAALTEELDSLRSLSDALPCPVWRQRPDGTVTWVNRAYVELAARQTGRPRGLWPPPSLFDDTELSVKPHSRLSLSDPLTGDDHWFDCHSQTVADDTLVTAIPANALIRAERARTEAVQCMARTFAHLTVGLAIFDASKRLAVFNPALGDLTGLPIDLLVERPSLETFLDHLRSRNVMPEPKDYTQWRQTVSRVEQSAANGTFGEMWHLPGDRTYRITGRPQTDGAFALLIEDVSAEIALTRQFRAEIDMSRSVMDAMEEAVAVFDRGGILVMTNTAYDTLWETDTRSELTHLTTTDALALWRQRTAPSGLWKELSDYMDRDHDRAGWSEDIQLRDGRSFTVHVSPLSGGAVLIRFSTTVGTRTTGRMGPEIHGPIQNRLKA